MLKLPEQASIEFLKKLAKERLRALREQAPEARLAEAQLAIAREHGFTSWRALKAEVDRRRAPDREAWFAACSAGDVAGLSGLAGRAPGLVHERDAAGATGLHRAVRFPDALRLLLERGADPDARDAGDHALALHHAAGRGPLASVEVLLDGGSDVHGEGDAHRLGVIGWATVFEDARRDVVELLRARGARHHVFSAIALGDLEALQRVVEDDAEALHRRLARSEQEQTALHYVIAPPDGLIGGRFRTGPHYRTLELLIELGAELEAVDAKGRTPLALAMLRGDREAMQRLHAAGAEAPAAGVGAAASPAELGGSVRLLTPMLAVRDLAATVAWYRALGFRLAGSHGEEGALDWACMTCGAAEVMFVPRRGPETASEPPSLWLRTSRLDEIYAALKQLQLERARAVLAGHAPATPELSFTQDLHTAFYGQRELSVRDPDGVEVYFCAPAESS